MTCVFGIVQSAPGIGQGFGAAIFFDRLAASDGAAEIAIAITATAPTNKIFDNDFMRTPSVEDIPRIARPMDAHKIKLAPAVDSDPRLL
jgi:hypothetical protein